MKGLTKAIMRTPHMMTSKVGLAKKSNDPEFDEYQRKFTTVEGAAEKLLKDADVFSQNVISLLNAGASFANHFATLFKPVVGEYDLIGKHPDSVDTIRNADSYAAVMEELKETLNPELELIESRIVGPIKELQTVLKQIRKSITKRDHKLVDYDRFNNSLTKLREKKEKSLSDEKNLFKLEQEFENASNEYEHINSTMKAELPHFLILGTRFIDPLFHSFYYMQLNIFYLLLEKLQGFAQGKYDTSGGGAHITQTYEERKTDAWQEIEALNITKRIVSTAKMMAARRQDGLAPSSASSLGRAPSTSSSLSAASRSPTFKKAPPPPPSSGSFKKAPPPPSPSAAPSTAPPPYTPNNAFAGALAKKAPPPPPPVKPKPKPKPQVTYVVALYDFAAQAEGDLDFKTGDRIEVVQRTDSTEDWWTGRLNGKQGIFPGNYVQET